MKEEKDIIHDIESIQPELSPEARSRMWSSIASKLPQQRLIPSPFLFSPLMKHSMTPLVVALILILAGGGTALASDASRPGDFMFPLDRTLEKIQLRLAITDAGKQNLTKAFTEERLEELREIIDEELVVSPLGSTNDSGTSTSDSATTSALQIETHVFTDMTVVKLEINNKKFYFESEAVTREDVITDIITRFPLLTNAEIDAQLDFEVEDRASRPKDRGIVSLSDTGEGRINRAVEEILSFLDTTSLDGSKKDNLLTTLKSEVEGVTNVRRNNDRIQIGSDDKRFEIRVDDNGDSRVEIRDGESRVRIEEKDGEVRVETKGKNDDSKKSEDAFRSSVLSTPVSSVSFEVEADVFFDTTVVKIEFNDDDFIFETEAITRSEVIREIQERFPSLTREQIDAQLDFEVEDRASRPTDGGTSASEEDTVRTRDDEDDEDHDYDDDHGGERGDDRDDDDDENDDDSSGKGRGGSSGRGGSDDEDDD